jgi:hypothetical protein
MSDDGMIYAERGQPRRAMLLGAMTPAWYDLATDEERARVIGRFRRLMDEWLELGARVVGTLDDDLFMVGEPGSPSFTFYLLFDVDDAQVAIDMIQRLREPVDGIRMDRYARFEAHVGRPFFLLESH